MAGGVNASDHSSTFASLCAELRERNCYVALLRPRTVGHSSGDVINSILKQFSGIKDTAAEHMDALLAWYADETGRRAVDSGEAPSEQNKSKRQKTSLHSMSAEHITNKSRPMVLLIEGTESHNAQSLEDLIVLLKAYRQVLPITIILGITTNADALNSMFSNDVLDLLKCTYFPLATPWDRLDLIVEKVLLGGNSRWPGLVFDQKVIHIVSQRFLQHCYSIDAFLQGLKVAALAHFRDDPLSIAAALLMKFDGQFEGLEAAMSSHSDVAKACYQDYKGDSAATVMHAARLKWSEWFVAVQWLCAALAATDLSRRNSLWQVYTRSLFPDCLQEDDDMRISIADLKSKLRYLDQDKLRPLVERLIKIAERTWGGPESVQLDELKEFLKESQGGSTPRGPGPEKASQEEDDDDEEEGEEEENPPLTQVAAPSSRSVKPKHDRFHSKTSRRDMLMKNALEQGSALKRQTQVDQCKPGVLFADWLFSFLYRVVQRPPYQEPGAEVFLCKRSALLNRLNARPRYEIHNALTHSHSYLSSDANALVGMEGVFNTTDEDTALAYKLFEQDHSCAHVVEWFSAFMEVHRNASRGETGGRKAALKKKGQRAEDGTDKALKRELAARFSQATAELQLVGLIKPHTRKQKSDSIQRLVHMPPMNVQ